MTFNPLKPEIWYNCQKIRPYLQWRSTTVTKKVDPPLSNEWALCMFLSQSSPFFYKIEPLVTYTRNIILFIQFISGCFESYGKCNQFLTSRWANQPDATRQLNLRSRRRRRIRLYSRKGWRDLKLNYSQNFRWQRGRTVKSEPADQR